MFKLKHSIFKMTCLTSLLFLTPLTADSFPYKPPREMYLVKGMSDLLHPVTTTVPEAQSFFNQGLTYKYAFNDDASYWSFQKAAELDPNMAMAHWGMALALGANINSPITPDREQAAYEHIQKAIKLSDRITSNEKGYIQALAQRYSADPKADLQQLELNYKNAMQTLVNTYLDDLDAATLYAESILNLNPWHQWTQEGKPIGDVLQAVETLESILKRAPKHLGANHYYIHAIEASKHPERALMSADRLRKLLPASGHLLHMPSHIYILVGDYEKAAQVNEEAIAADQEYIRQFGMTGNYPVHYLSHNYYFLIRAYCLLGDYKKALRTAQDLQMFYVPHFSQMPEIEEYATAPQWVLMRFNAWEDILKLKSFPEEMKLSSTLLYFAKAYAALSLKNNEQAENYLDLFKKGQTQFTEDAKFGYNRAQVIAEIAEKQYLAKKAYLNGQLPDAIKILEKAVILQDNLNYNEPPDWHYPLRESLGAILLENRQHTEAEKVFREELDRLPRNGRALFGLLCTLKAQQKDSDAFWIEKEFNKAWQFSTAPLTMDILF